VVKHIIPAKLQLSNFALWGSLMEQSSYRNAPHKRHPEAAKLGGRRDLRARNKAGEAVCNNVAPNFYETQSNFSPRKGWAKTRYTPRKRLCCRFRDPHEEERLGVLLKEPLTVL
jgi:hypothetical protein